MGDEKKMRTHVVKGVLTPDQIAEELVERFGMLLGIKNEYNQETSKETLEDFLAGAGSALIAIGFGEKETERIVDTTLGKLSEMAGKVCDCDKCKAQRRGS